MQSFRGDPQAMITQVARARGLPYRKPVRVVFQLEPDFMRSLEHKAAQDAIAATASDTSAFMTVFGFLHGSPGGGGGGGEAAGPPPPDEGSQIGSLQREEIVAFYDDVAHAVHVRQSKIENPEEAAATLAHEIGHALQHENFRVPPVAQIKNEDERLAALALMEGDAMLIMLAYISDREQVPLHRTVVRADDNVREGAVERYLNGGGGPALKNAPLIVRERLHFPYLSGLSFLGAVHRAGGFPLVNRVYSRPPITTEQVLHPEKYLAGEVGVGVPVPTPPPGYQVRLAGHMGELQTRLALHRCNSILEAERAAAGWGGDAFSIVSSPRGGMALLWNSVWDTEQDAIEFQTALGRSSTCWGEPPTFVVREKNRVAVVRGLSVQAAAPMTRAMVTAAVDYKQAVPPFGPVGIPAIRRMPQVRPDYVSGKSVVSERLNLVVPIPPGYSVDLSDESITMRYEGSLLLVAISERMTTARGAQITATEFVSALANAGASVQPAGPHGTARTALGQATQHGWQFGNGARARLLQVPMCSGTGSLMVAQAWRTPHAQRTLDWWLGALRPLGASTIPPVCAELNP